MRKREWERERARVSVKATKRRLIEAHQTSVRDKSVLIDAPIHKLQIKSCLMAAPTSLLKRWWWWQAVNMYASRKWWGSSVMSAVAPFEATFKAWAWVSEVVWASELSDVRVFGEQALPYWWDWWTVTVCVDHPQHIYTILATAIFRRAALLIQCNVVCLRSCRNDIRSNDIIYLLSFTASTQGYTHINWFLLQ